MNVDARTYPEKKHGLHTCVEETCVIEHETEGRVPLRNQRTKKGHIFPGIFRFGSTNPRGRTYGEVPGKLGAQKANLLPKIGARAPAKRQPYQLVKNKIKEHGAAQVDRKYITQQGRACSS